MNKNHKLDSYWNDVVSSPLGNEAGRKGPIITDGNNVGISSATRQVQGSEWLVDDNMMSPIGGEHDTKRKREVEGVRKEKEEGPTKRKCWDKDNVLWNKAEIWLTNQVYDLDDYIMVMDGLQTAWDDVVFGIMQGKRVSIRKLLPQYPLKGGMQESNGNGKKALSVVRKEQLIVESEKDRLENKRKQSEKKSNRKEVGVPNLEEYQIKEMKLKDDLKYIVKEKNLVNKDTVLRPGASEFELFYSRYCFDMVTKYRGYRVDLYPTCIPSKSFGPYFTIEGHFIDPRYHEFKDMSYGLIDLGGNQFEIRWFLGEIANYKAIKVRGPFSKKGDWIFHDANGTEDLSSVSMDYVYNGVNIHPYVVNLIESITISRRLTTFNLRTIVAQINRALNASIFKNYYTSEEIWKAVLEIWTEHVDVQEENIDEMEEQASKFSYNAKRFDEPFDQAPEQNLIYATMRTFLPAPVANYMITKCKQFLSSDWCNSIRAKILSFIQWLKTGRAPLLLFESLNPLLSVILEELIKCVPLTGLGIAIFESVRDHKRGTLTFPKLMYRIFAHSWHEFLPVSWLTRLFLLPVRVMVHFMLNMWKNRKVDESVADVEILEEEVILEPTDGYIAIEKESNRKVYSDVPIQAVLKDTRLTNSLVIVAQDQYLNPPKEPIGYVDNVPSWGYFPSTNALNFVLIYEKRFGKPQKELGKVVLQDIEQRLDIIARNVKEKFDDNFEQFSFQEWLNHVPKEKKQLYINKKKTIDKNGWLSNFENITAFVKSDEFLFKMGRIVFAYSNESTVMLGPTMYSLQKFLSRHLFNGHFDVSPLLFGEEIYCKSKPMYVYYAVGNSDELEAFFDRAINDDTAYYLAVLGDDNVIIDGDKVLTSDFSRYDSTQNAIFQKWFKKIFLTCFEHDKDACAIYDSIVNWPIAFKHKGENYPVKRPLGLLTGCLETSLSNTLLTAFSAMVGLVTSKELKDVPLLWETWGFLPKAHVSKVTDGFEFLKKAWVPYFDGNHVKVTVAPLLCNFLKIGKSLTNPYKINQRQDAPKYLKAQIWRGAIPHGVSTLYDDVFDTFGYDWLAMIPHYDDSHYKLMVYHKVYVECEAREVAIDEFNERRYGLARNDVKQFLLSMVGNNYPVKHMTDSIAMILKVDYGVGE